MAKIANASSVKKETSAKRSTNESQEIAKLAYELFLERGGEHGHDQEDWSRAEAIVRNRKSS